jgi:hypothetical protein
MYREKKPSTKIKNKRVITQNNQKFIPTKTPNPMKSYNAANQDAWMGGWGYAQIPSSPSYPLLFLYTRRFIQEVSLLRLLLYSNIFEIPIPPPL